MKGPDKTFVIGATIDDIHQWSTANGIPWHRVEPVTGANQLRVRPGQGRIIVAWADTSKMNRAVLSVIKTQLSIRRCLGNVFDATGLYRSTSMSPLSIEIVADYYQATGQHPNWKPA